MKKGTLELKDETVEVLSVESGDLPQQISNSLNALLSSNPDGFEQIDLEAEPVPIWRFKITLVPKRT